MSGCYLLDTCALLWATSDPARLSQAARAVIDESNHRILISHATIWELSIKVTVGKIKLPADFFEALPEMGYEMLSMHNAHFTAYRQLPLHHRDPFDRLLVAQSQVESLPLISFDAQLAAYGIEQIW